MKRIVSWAPYIVWTIALAATAGSLFVSEVLKYVPCVLCWYQRILVYPMVLLVPVGVMRRDINLPYYLLPLSLLGSAIALYHSLLQWGVIPEAVAPCVNGVSCAEVQIELAGFITLPFMSLAAFLMITALCFLMIRSKHE
jgi:disulfide bond formation protein DsbB